VLHNLFANQRAFEEAAFALGRFGFVFQGSTADSMGNYITKRGLDYLDSLDLEGIDVKEVG
jgi:hypothetical protein